MKKWIVAVFVLVMAFGPQTQHAYAQSPDYNPTSCVFQYPAVDRSPTLSNIVATTNGNESPYWTNYTWDESFRGLHRTNTTGWPGVDFLTKTTVPFKNGGTVVRVWYDDSEAATDPRGVTGGNSIIIKGEGVCEGWIVYYGHLDYDPTTKFKVGQHVGPDEVIGVPGCSGAEGHCWEGDPKDIPVGADWSWKANHFSLGYKDNVFEFGDGTKIVYQAGYYWIHIARMEDRATNMAIMTPPATIPQGKTLEYDKYKGWYLQDESISFTLGNGFTVTPNMIVYLLAALVLIVLSILVPSFRKVLLILLAGLVIAGLIIILLL